MGCIIKILFITIPLALVIFGAWLVFNAVLFWINVTGPVQLSVTQLEFSKPSSFEAVAFIPDSIRPEYAPVPIEIEVRQITQTAGITQVVKIEMAENCEFLRATQNKFELSFSDTTSNVQAVKADLEIRDIRPPITCEVNITAITDTATATLSEAMPIDAWTGTLLAVGQLLAGVLSGGVGLAGVFSALFA